MPIKFPCIQCRKPVKSNQKAIFCEICKLWMHFKCSNLTKAHYDFLATNVDIPFNCQKCRPLLSVADGILNTPSLTVDSISNAVTSSNTINTYQQLPADSSVPHSNIHNSEIPSDASDVDFSDAHSSDFTLELEDDYDCELRGLNFNNLPPQFHKNIKNKASNVNTSKFSYINYRTIKYKYTCSICQGACRENVQDSIQCTWCDEWVHQKCTTNLSYDQFLKHCLPENIDLPYYCEICEFGSAQKAAKQPCISTSSVSSLDSSDILKLSPNSIFSNKDDVLTTEYFTTEELNIEIEKTPDNIRLIHINAVSLCKHIDNITAMIAELSKLPSIIFISETRVADEKENFQKSQIKIPGYTFILDNSPTCAGGTAIYVSDGLTYKERDDIVFNYPNVEACFIEIICKRPGSNPIFGAMYRHPNFYARPFCSHLGEFLELFAENGTNLTILGDLNIDLGKTNPVTKEYINTLTSLGFSLLINQPTRIFHYEGTNNLSCSTIDHIITNSSSAFSKAGILIAEVSDHLPIFGIMSLSKRVNPFKNTYRRSYPESKKNSFVAHLQQNIDSSNLNLGPNLLLERVLLSIKDAIEQTFPLKKVSNKQAKQILNPWMTNEILKQRRIRDKLKKDWLKSGKIVNSPLHLNYKRTRNKVLKMCRKAHRSLIQNDCKNTKGDSGKMWKVINKTMKTKDKLNITPDFVKVITAEGSTKKIQDKTKIANEMNRQFVEMGAKLANELPTTDASYTDYLPSPNPNHERFVLRTIPESKVGKLIEELDESKGVGIDKIPPKILKWAAPVLIPILTKLFNMCLMGGIYPDSLKIARVKPIFKGGIKNLIPSYRPISILTQINRIFEKILRDDLYDFVKDKLYQKQFGFRPRNSTEHPVLDMKEIIFENCSKKLVSCILFLDLKKSIRYSIASNST